MPSFGSSRFPGRPRILSGLSEAAEAYLLLTFTTACWGGNAVASRLLVGEASPMIVTLMRWAMLAALLSGFMLPRIFEVLPVLRRSWLRIVAMAICGFSFFNALFYLSAHYTTAVNIAILQGAIPVFVMLGAALLFGTRITAIQAAGVAITLVGVAIIATRGHLTTLAAFHLNIGDAIVLVACALYSGYTLALRDRPAVPALTFFSVLAIIAFLTSLPLAGFEVLHGTAQWPTLKGWGILVFIALLPSFLAQLSFMRGVRLIGPGRAGLFANLAPVFGALFAVLILDEPFALYHFAALVLVIGGILIAETLGRKRERRAAAGSAP